MLYDTNSNYDWDLAVKKVAKECNVPEIEVIEAIKKLLKNYKKQDAKGDE